MGHTFDHNEQTHHQKHNKTPENHTRYNKGVANATNTKGDT